MPHHLSRRELLTAVLGVVAAPVAAKESNLSAADAFVPPRRDVVDVHAHFLPPAYLQTLRAAGIELLDGGMPVPQWSVERTIAVMDDCGIETAILSVSSPGLTVVSPGEEPRLARAINEAGAAIRSDRNGRFGIFATLPMSDPKAGLHEIDYALDTLKLQGFILPTHHRGRYLGHADFRTVFAALNERRAIVFIHPTSPTCVQCIDGGRPAPMIEFPFDTTRTVVDLIYSGTVEAFPDIRFILPHAGGTLPFLAQRIAAFASLPFVTPRPAGGPPEVLRQLARFHYDVALSAGPAQIEALRSLVPMSRILFGSDWPFTPAPFVARALAALQANERLTAADRDAIFRDNARALLPMPAGQA